MLALGTKWTGIILAKTKLSVKSKLKSKSKYRPLCQMEYPTIFYMIQFWLLNVKLSLKGKGNQATLVKFQEKTLINDFIAIYVLNRETMTMEGSEVTVQGKPIILKPLTKYCWLVTVKDAQGHSLEIKADPTLLGSSVLHMSSLGEFRNILEPEVVMAICFYQELI